MPATYCSRRTARRRHPTFAIAATYTYDNVNRLVSVTDFRGAFYKSDHTLTTAWAVASPPRIQIGTPAAPQHRRPGLGIRRRRQR
jgi:hypothetical protein